MAHHGNTGIQQHSVGTTFPYVVYRQDCDGVPFWFVTGPGFNVNQPGKAHWDYESAWSRAWGLASLYRAERDLEARRLRRRA